MLKNLTELFIKDYFRIEAIFGGRNIDMAEVFNKLGTIYNVETAEMDELHTYLDRDSIKNIKSMNDYYRYQRIRQFFNVIEKEIDDDNYENEIINIKGNILIELIDGKILNSTNETLLTIQDRLKRYIGAGHTMLLRVVGFLMMEGIIYDVNKVQAMNYLKKAAKWNDIGSLMMCRAYCDDVERSEYDEKLVFLLERNNMNMCDDIIAKGEKTSDKKTDERYELLEYLFDNEIADRRFYEESYAKVLFSDVLDIDAKRKLLTINKNSIAQVVGSIPLSLKIGDDEAVDLTPIKNLPINRDKELAAIEQAFNNIDLRVSELYKPLCISVDGQAMFDMYIKAVQGCFKGANVEIIDVGSIDKSEVAFGNNNTFVGCCDDKKFNVYCLVYRGDIDEPQLEISTKFLMTKNRKTFNINSLGISMDLSAILPICFTDSINETAVSPFCDVVRIAAPTLEDKVEILDYLLKNKCREYAIPNIVIEDELRDKLISHDVDYINNWLDQSIRKNRERGVELRLDSENTETPTRSNNQFGFGGAINENK